MEKIPHGANLRKKKRLPHNTIFRMPLHMIDSYGIAVLGHITRIPNMILTIKSRHQKDFSPDHFKNQHLLIKIKDSRYLTTYVVFI